MTSTITGLDQAARNANDGISLAQTAEGALGQINDNLQRIRELTVQAQNHTNTAQDIDSIQEEINQRLEEINRVTSQTGFNGRSLFSDSATTGTSFSIQVGAKDGQNITIAIGASIGAGNATSAGGWNMLDTLAAGTQGRLATGDARGVSAAGLDVLQADALAILDEGISSVDQARSNLGAMQNRFETALDNIETATVNLTAARSRIQDADFAVEVSNLTRAQILQQAGATILAQANQSPQSVLSLLS